MLSHTAENSKGHFICCFYWLWIWSFAEPADDTVEEHTKPAGKGKRIRRVTQAIFHVKTRCLCQTFSGFLEVFPEVYTEIRFAATSSHHRYHPSFSFLGTHDVSGVLWQFIRPAVSWHDPDQKLIPERQTNQLIPHQPRSCKYVPIRSSTAPFEPLWPRAWTHRVSF